MTNQVMECGVWPRIKFSFLWSVLGSDRLSQQLPRHIRSQASPRDMVNEWLGTVPNRSRDRNQEVTNRLTVVHSKCTYHVKKSCTHGVCFTLWCSLMKLSVLMNLLWESKIWLTRYGSSRDTYHFIYADVFFLISLKVQMNELKIL